jgi:hypothetical protein
MDFNLEKDVWPFGNFEDKSYRDIGKLLFLNFLKECPLKVLFLFIDMLSKVSSDSSISIH